MNHPLDKLQYCPVCGALSFQTNTARSKQCKKCGFEYYANVAAAVAALIFNSKGELLLTRRAMEPAKGMLDLPGGFVEINETAEDALIREIKEELNIEIEIDRLMFSLPNEYFYSGITVYTLDFFFCANIIHTSTIIPADDVESYDFYSIDKIPLEEIGLKSIRNAIKILKHNK